MADDYEFDVEGMDGEMEEEEQEEEWESEVRESYFKAKDVQMDNFDEAKKIFESIISKDKGGGNKPWAWKCKKSLYRLCIHHKKEEQMLKYFKDSLDDTTHANKDRVKEVDKMINKASDRSTHLSADCRRQIAQIARDYICSKYQAADPANSDKMYFTLTSRIAQFNLDDKHLDALMKNIDELYNWCGTGKEAEQRRGNQILAIYAFHIQYCTEKEELKKLRELYQKAASVESAVAQPKVLGVIHESGGKMYLRQRQWASAFESLKQAFKCYDTAGDQRKISALQYLVVASMLSESGFNPFDMNEAKAYQGEPEITIMTQLLDVAGTQKSQLKGGSSSPAAPSGGKRDVRKFIDILNDPARSKHLTRDPFLYSLIEPLIQRVRGVGLCDLVKPYTRIKLSFIATALATSAADAEKLAGRLILEGRLQGLVDQVHGVLLLSGAAAADDDEDDEEGEIAPREVLLQKLLESSAQLRGNVIGGLRR